MSEFGVSKRASDKIVSQISVCCNLHLCIACVIDITQRRADFCRCSATRRLSAAVSGSMISARRSPRPAVGSNFVCREDDGERAGGRTSERTTRHNPVVSFWEQRARKDGERARGERAEQRQTSENDVKIKFSAPRSAQKMCARRLSCQAACSFNEQLARRADRWQADFVCCCTKKRVDKLRKMRLDFCTHKTNQQ